MKIAFFTYPAAFQNIGGGEIVLLKMKEYLEKQGAHVALFDTWKERIEDYDILQTFGSVKDCYGLISVAKARGVKTATTPILWSDIRRALHTEGSLLTKGDLLARHLLKLTIPAFPSTRRRILTDSDMLFPNSVMEQKHISRLFAIPESKMRVLYNGVDPVFLDAEPELFRRRYPGPAFILSVGRMEPRKNQLNLIRAVKGMSGSPRLVLIGSPVSGFEPYAALCRKEGEGITEFLPSMRHDDPVLRSAYAAAEAFVLPGWFETPGLVALEAALAGARVVATSGGSTREYFGDLVEYLDPSRAEDMRLRIVRTLDAPRDGKLKRHVLENFTWEKVAARNMEYYRELLSVR